MSELTGIEVTLTTAATENAGTDDHVYIGVIGTGGGREFPLDDPEFDDFEIAPPITYKLGAPWEPVPAARNALPAPVKAGASQRSGVYARRIGAGLRRVSQKAG